MLERTWRICGQCAEWKVEYALCDFSLGERVGKCKDGSIRDATHPACEHFTERKSDAE